MFVVVAVVDDDDVLQFFSKNRNQSLTFVSMAATVKVITFEKESSVVVQTQGDYLEMYVPPKTWLSINGMCVFITEPFQRLY